MEIYHEHIATYARARIDTGTKERAADALAAIGLPISDAIGLFMLRIADECPMPFEIKAPKVRTKRAMAELEAGTLAGKPKKCTLTAVQHLGI